MGTLNGSLFYFDRSSCLVKAAGGIRTIEEMLAFLQAGARRFGSTRTAQFVAAFRVLPPDRKEAFAPFLTASTV